MLNLFLSHESHSAFLAKDEVNNMEEGAVKQNKSEMDKSNIDSNELKVSKEPSTRIEIKNPTPDRKVGRMSLR